MLLDSLIYLPFPMAAAGITLMWPAALSSGLVVLRCGYAVLRRNLYTLKRKRNVVVVYLSVNS